MKTITFIFALLLLSCCNSSTEELPQKLSAEQVVEQMEWVNSVDIESLLVTKSANPPKYMATNLNGNIKIPGLSKSHCEYIVQAQSFKILVGMSEVIYGEKHASLRVKTRDFASRYNQKLFKKLNPSSSLPLNAL